MMPNSDELQRVVPIRAGTRSVVTALTKEAEDLHGKFDSNFREDSENYPERLNPACEMTTVENHPKAIGYLIRLYGVMQQNTTKVFTKIVEGTEEKASKSSYSRMRDPQCIFSKARKTRFIESRTKEVSIKNPITIIQTPVSLTRRSTFCRKHRDSSGSDSGIQFQFRGPHGDLYLRS